MVENKQNIKWCRKQIGPGHEIFTDTEIEHIHSMLSPVIYLALAEAEKQWKANRK